MPKLNIRIVSSAHRHRTTWLAWVRWIGIAAACAVVPSAQADEPALLKTRPVQVAPNTFVMPAPADADALTSHVPGPNLSFVVTNTSVVLIDAPGSAALAARWLEQIRRVTPKPLSHVLLTRPPADSADGLAALKAVGAVIVAQRIARPTAPADETARPAAASAARAAADLWLDDSTDLLIGGMHVQAQMLGPPDVESAGRQGMVYVLPDEGVLFVGGLVVPGGIPDIGQADTRRWIAALDELLTLDARVLVAAQGAASSPPTAALKTTRDYLAWLRETMGEALRQNEPFDAAYDKADWGRYAELAQFDAFNRANASATYAQMQRDGD
jgi:glyoxylase-like metal-dependent hydrolase (beta-lactamase superfamily II)